MDWNLFTTIVTTIITLGVTIWISYYFYKKSTRVVDNNYKIKNARKEMIRILSNELTINSDEIDNSYIESLISSKYKECKVKSPIYDEFPIIIDELIAELSDNVFVSSEKRQAYIKKAVSLKNLFRKRQTSLRDAVNDWKDSSILRISFQLFGMAYFLFVIGIAIMLVSSVIQILSHQSTSLVNEMFLQVVILVPFMVIVVVSVQYTVLKNKRDARFKNLKIMIEDSISNSLRKYSTDVKLEQNVSNLKGGLSTADLALVSKGKKIPIEIKSGIITKSVISQLTTAMKELESKRGILVTPSKTSSKIVSIAKQKNIVIISNIDNENDIDRVIKNSELLPSLIINEAIGTTENVGWGD